MNSVQILEYSRESGPNMDLSKGHNHWVVWCGNAKRWTSLAIAASMRTSVSWEE
ncbi:hypothetical protein DPMN_156898 [Dreissena polymorpha]|uniref:Uncharacterized protein n=1 Tax=Dreissena polymorpha TaxID=45954 RepID=A0A9D4JCV5_DREPO|nr:hypothetical protein DPMN_156898 [Dreissena polymorpha]